MANLNQAFAEAVKLSHSITQFLRFSTYFGYSDLSGLDIDFNNPEEVLVWDELKCIAEKLADIRADISYLTLPVAEESSLRKGTDGKYRTTKRYRYDCGTLIEALVSDDYHDAPYWTVTRVEHNGKDYYLVGHKDTPMKGLRVRVRNRPLSWE